MKTIDPTEYEGILTSRRGAQVRIWQFSPSLSRLALQVRFPHDSSDVYLVGVTCQYICGPMSWEDGHLELVEQEDAVHGTSHVVRDLRAGFELRCSGVALFHATMSDFDLDSDTSLE